LSILSAIGHVGRLAGAALVMAREGVFAGVDAELLPPIARPGLGALKLIGRKRAGSHGLSRAMEKLGPSYVKLGQFLATRPDIVSADVAHELERLQDRVAPLSREVAVKRVEAAFQAPLATVFVEFGEPVAAASIAQVHRAKALDAEGATRVVAVKVLRPGVERRLQRDLADMSFAARFAEEHFPDARRLRPVQVVETLARSVRMEMDFRLEAAAADEYGANLKTDPNFRAPKIDWDRTTREVLTMEWIEGTPLNDPDKLTALGFDIAGLGHKLIQSFLTHALRDGFFHADMHQGNFLVDAEGRIVALDFGIMGRLGRAERRFLAEILYGFIRRDYLRVAEVHFEAGYVPRHYRVEDFAQAIRAIGEPIHARPADQISMARLLTLLFEVTALFDMHTRTELVLLQKTMVVVEGVARKLDPRLNMWATAEPVVGEWIAENLGPKGRLEDLGAKMRAFSRALADAPAKFEQFGRAMEAIERRELDQLERQASKALWVIAVILVVIGVRLWLR
jgi:ubiquinone biosynthesis protein